MDGYRMKRVWASVVMATLMAGQANGQAVGAADAPAAESPAVEAPATVSSPSPDAPASSAFQVARLGDSRMSCEALISEINALNKDVADNQTAMTGRAMDASRDAMRGPKGASMAVTALTLGSGVAAALIPGAGLALGAVQGMTDMANQAAAAAYQANQERQMDAMMTEMTAAADALTPLMSRIDHLGDISYQKGC